MAEMADTSDFDPRHDRAQTIEGAKARYVTQDGYDEQQLEADIDRLLTEGEHPDERVEPLLDGQVVHI